jgi:regulator of cell morphogenesis and NO signaling
VNITRDASDNVIAEASSKPTPVPEPPAADYCCGGPISSHDACAHTGISEEDILQRLGKNEGAIGAADASWVSAPLCDLTRHIRETHHRYVREAIRRIQPLLVTVKAKQATTHTEVAEVERVFLQLSREMIMHMQKEEQILFPYIDALERAAQGREAIEPPFFQTVRNPIQAMMNEHDSADQLTQRIQGLTAGYTAPQNASADLESLYQELRAFEADLRQHVHVENDILFPGAVKLEAQVI